MKKNNTLYVCGDSYMSPVVDYPNTHHSEMLSNCLGYELVPLSRGGMSNMGICLQVEEAIKSKASLVLFGSTSSDRIEIPTGNNDEGYTLDNVLYCDQTSLSSQQRNTYKKPYLISDTLYCLMESDHHHLPYSSHIESVYQLRKDAKNYYKSLFDFSWKQKIDDWAIYACLHKLYASEIPFIIVYPKSQIMEECKSFLHEKHYLSKMVDVNFNNDGEDPGYHTSFDDQKVLYNMLLEHLDQFSVLG